MGDIEVVGSGGNDGGGSGGVGVIGEQQGFREAGIGDANEDRDAAGGNFAGTVDDLIAVAVVERGTFAGGTECEDAVDASGEQVFDDAEHGGRVELPIGGHRRNNRRNYASQTDHANTLREIPGAKNSRREEEYAWVCARIQAK